MEHCSDRNWTRLGRDTIIIAPDHQKLEHIMRNHLYVVDGYTPENSQKVGEIIERIPGRFEVRNTRNLSVLPLDDDQRIDFGYFVFGLSDLSPDDVREIIEDDLSKIGVRVEIMTSYSETDFRTPRFMRL